MCSIVAKSLSPNSLEVVIEERADRTTQRSDGGGRGRLETGDEAKQVAAKNEEAQSHQKRSKALAVVADDFLALAFDKPLSTLEDMLQGSRPIDRQLRPYKHKQSNQKEEHEHFHRGGVGDWGLGVLRLNVESAQQSGNRNGEKSIQERCEPKLFMHK